MLTLNGYGKASKSNPSGNCVEAGQFSGYHKASASWDTNCVEEGEYFTASTSNDTNCVECKFVTASISGGVNSDGTCVEVAANMDHVHIRDSKERDKADRTVLTYTHPEWKEYVEGLKRGHGAIQDSDTDPANPWIMRDSTGRVCRYNNGEWDAFMDGVWKGEFDAVKPGDELSAPVVA